MGFGTRLHLYCVQTLEMPTGYPTEFCQVCSVLIYVQLEGIGVINISLGKCGKWKKQRASSTLGEAEVAFYIRCAVTRGQCRPPACQREATALLERPTVEK